MEFRVRYAEAIATEQACEWSLEGQDWILRFEGKCLKDDVSQAYKCEADQVELELDLFRVERFIVSSSEGDLVKGIGVARQLLTAVFEVAGDISIELTSSRIDFKEVNLVGYSNQTGDLLLRLS